MPSDFLLPLLDPTAPLPAFWPSGGLGAFLLFLIPIGGGIPLASLWVLATYFVAQWHIARSVDLQAGPR